MSDIESSEKPHVYVSAFFCDSVIRDDKNLLTAVRINDGYRISPFRAPLQLADGTVDLEHGSVIVPPLRLSLIVRISSDNPGEFTFKITATLPSGKALRPGTLPVSFKLDGTAAGHTFNTNLNIPNVEEGDYWFSFYIDDVLATKLPMRVSVGEPIALTPVESVSSPAPQAGPEYHQK
jgi:hypothetical protein